jgi:hypothetical protein
MDQVNAWAGLPSGFAWNLCYKGTRDNTGFFSSAGFHKQCDNRGQSFFVAKSTKDKLFGGYNLGALDG